MNSVEYDKFIKTLNTFFDTKDSYKWKNCNEVKLVTDIRSLITNSNKITESEKILLMIDFDKRLEECRSNLVKETTNIV